MLTYTNITQDTTMIRILTLEEHNRYHLVLFIGLQHYGTQLRLKLKTPKLLPPSVQS